MRRRLNGLIFSLAVVSAACTGADSAIDEPTTTSTSPSTTEAPAVERSYAGVDPAPEFPEGLDWLNVAAPLSLEQLRGKVVLLDFWTYGCINCIHIIPDLERLEAEYADELVVIGVHSAKFVNEAATDNIRQVVLRYEIEHPVVNDGDFVVWNSWGARAWPTVVLVDPAGKIVGGHEGEGVYTTVEPVIASLVAEFDARGELDRTPLELAPERAKSADTLLSFPGKLLADPAGGRLFVADSGRHRIVEADLATGEVRAVYGSPVAGHTDGIGTAARFDAPQGMALSEDGATLYVADTDNHAVRAIDLPTGRVETVAGTGEIGYPPSSGPASEVRLNSPWDVVLRGQTLYIAMAGVHQIWAFELDGGTVGPLVGNGREGTRNGVLAEAELAQPSGLAFDAGGRLYFADSESSAVRYADVLDAAGATGIVAGSDEHLFDFGDLDGPGPEARLQHPLGVAVDEARGALYIADTYNSKLKRVDLASGLVDTFLGGEQGWADGFEPRFHEPGGLSLAGDLLYVADTNNHAVRVVDLETLTVSTLVLKGIERFEPPPDSDDFRGTVLRLEPADVAPGELTIRLDVTLPPDHKINEEAPSGVEWTTAGGLTPPEPPAASLTGTALPVALTVDMQPGTGTLTGDITLIYCREDAQSLCLIEQLRVEIPLTVTTEAPSTDLVVSHEIELPDLGA